MKSVSTAHFAAALVAVLLVCHVTHAAVSAVGSDNCNELNCNAFSDDFRDIYTESSPQTVVTTSSSNIGSCVRSTVPQRDNSDGNVDELQNYRRNVKLSTDKMVCIEEGEISEVTNCESFAPGDATTCQACKSGFGLLSGKGKPTCEKCSVANCDNCDGNVDECKKCSGILKPSNDNKACDTADASLRDSMVSFLGVSLTAAFFAVSLMV